MNLVFLYYEILVRILLPSSADVIQMPVTIPPADLYHHIVAHCSVFDTQTLELRPSSPSSNPADICLFIHVSPKSLGPTTTPQLSKLLHDTQVRVSCDCHMRST